MEAKDLIKKAISIESIYEHISDANINGHFKVFIPHYVYVEEKDKLQLIEDGFKVYNGDWDGVIVNALIIEW